MNCSKTHIVIVLFLFFFFWGCEKKYNPVEADTSNVESSYPTVYYPLPEDYLQERAKAFDELNPGFSPAEFDEYGFLNIPSHNLSNMHFGSKDTIAKEKAVELAQQFVIKNKKFTNVYSVTNLNNYFAAYCGNHWEIIFKQTIFGYPIKHPDVQILVYVKDNGVYAIYGGFYTNSLITKPEKYNRIKAISNLDGYRRNYNCWGSFEMVVEADMIGEPNDIFWCAFDMDGCKELHLVWQVPIMDNYNRYWIAYVDAITFEVLILDHLFVC